jgi:peptidoglycan/LPS O-acetylase OafA/YrhL
MGILRLYLALCVVATHSNAIFPWRVHDGTEAVQIFFIISGFYMALIAGKYSRASEFYLNRFLRIFVPYWFVVLAVILGGTIGGVLFNYWWGITAYAQYSGAKNGLMGVLFVSFANIVLFLQDAVLFLTHDANEPLRFTSDFSNSQAPLWRFQIIPQAWSVGVELLFYLLVPFLSTLRTRYLVLVVSISLSLRFLAYECLGLKHDPWTFRFFPFELALFGIGMISFRVYEKYNASICLYLKRYSVDTKAKYAAYLFIMVVIFFCAVLARSGISHYFHLGYNYSVLILYLAWALVLPVLFFLNKENRWDRFIGELSYPIYLVHLCLISCIAILMRRMKIPVTWLGVITALFSVSGAVLLMKCVILPIENRRHSIARQWITKKRERHHAPTSV